MIAVESFKDETKPHKCPEEIREDAELKIPKNVNNKNNVCELLFYDTRSSNEYDKENDGNDLDDTDVAGNNNMIRRKSHDTAAANGGLCYTDKNVTACDSPEIVVCYKESTYHVVKDICVDEGVLAVHEKFLFGEKDSVKCNSNSDQCESEEDLVETKSPEDRNNGKVDDPKTKQDVEESSRERLADSESSSSCNQEHLIVTREAKEEVVTTSENVLTLGDEQKPLNNNNNNNIHRHEGESPSQLQENEQRSLETTALKTEEPRKTEEISSVSTTTSREPNILVGESFEDDKLFSSGFGETSFSAGESVSISGHISSYLGPVVVSGRLSVRSDASTTSGRSFAFPILQSEWNSSPERMAKAEKKRLKGWREILLCCRFS